MKRITIDAVFAAVVAPDLGCRLPRTRYRCRVRLCFSTATGTMIEEVGYFGRARDAFQWYPWTIDAVRLLNRAGFLVCVVTNQGGIGLGLFSEAFVRRRASR